MRKILLIFVIAFLMLSGCSAKDKSSLPEGSIVLVDAKTDVEHFTKYTDGETVFLANRKTGDTATLYLLNGVINECLHIEISEDIGKDITGVDPLSIGVGIKEDIPCTYTSNLENSTVYLSSLVKSGWFVSAIFSNSQCSDIYMTRDSSNIRVLVFEDRLKVFQDVSGKTEDPYTYIIR